MNGNQWLRGMEQDARHLRRAAHENPPDDIPGNGFSNAAGRCCCGTTHLAVT
ncbi:MAG: hypothetical protein R3C59_19475 [Planctomycetaceae bacterium]